MPGRSSRLGFGNVASTCTLRVEGSIFGLIAFTLPVNVYQTSFQVFRFGLGGAMSVVTLVIMLVPAVIYLRAFKLNRREATA